MTERINRPGANKKTDPIRYMVHHHLQTHALGESLPTDVHLDEDAICAFVEGQLQQTESVAIISHLVACAFCRQTTSQLIRLESEFGPEEEATMSDAGVGRIRLLLERMASTMTSSSQEDVVFAYQDPATEPGKNDEVTQTTESDTGSEGDQ